MFVSNEQRARIKPQRSLFTEMDDAFSQLEEPRLRAVLMDSLRAERDSVLAVAASFERFTAAAQPLDVRRRFFASWQKTNNSAMSVEGLANRITAEAERTLKESGDPAVALQLFRSAARLNRVADEDLGVGGQTLHFELFYRMATAFTGGDDAWQSRAFCSPTAAEFKAWLDSLRLREPILTGMLSMLIHEGYTHAELEMIASPFARWATGALGLAPAAARRSIAWILVHIGGTEKAHFAHASAALEHYVTATGSAVDLTLAEQVFRGYLRRKGDVMKQLGGLP